MSSDDRIRAAFHDLARQAEHADPEPGLAALESIPAQAPRRPWLGAVAAGAIIVVAVGAIAVFQLGDDPFAPAGSDTTTAVPASTVVPGPVSTLTDSVTDTTTARGAAEVTAERPALLLADKSGIVAMQSDGRATQLTEQPAVVAYSDGHGGMVFQSPNDRLGWISPTGDQVELDATGELQGVIEVGGGPAAVVIEPSSPTEGGRVLATALVSGARTELTDRGDVVRYSVWREFEAITTTAGDASGLTVLQDGAEIFSLNEPGLALQGGIVIPVGSGDAQVGYFRNDPASNTSQVIVRDAAGEVVDEYEIENGIGMWLDAAGDRLVATFGDGSETFGYVLIDRTTGDQQRPPFPGTATLLAGPVPVGSTSSPAETVRWRITGLDAGAFLNVRAGPGIEHQRMGRLFTNDETVEVTGEGVLDPDGTGWYEVRLDDGTVGFASNEFLAPPAAWEVGFNEVACGAGTVATGVTPPPPSGGIVGSEIGGWAHVGGDQCDRYVVAFAAGGIGDGRIVPADHVPGGLSARGDRSRVSITLPGVQDVEPIATHAVLDEIFALIAQPADLGAPLEIRLLRDDGAGASLSVLSHPARLLIDVPKRTGSLTTPTPVIGEGATLLERPVDPDGNGVTAPVDVTGYARWFEAQGQAEVRDVGGAAAAATITGPSLIESGPGVPGSAGVSAAWSPTWGEFVLTIDAPPGQYELFVGEACLVDETNDVWMPCGVTERFTVIN